MRRHDHYPTWETWWKAGRPEAMSWTDFLAATDQWVEEGSHSGPEPSEALAQYTRLNRARMRRVAKTLSLPEGLSTRLKAMHAGGHHWVLITESWCGDGAYAGVWVAAMARLAGVPLDVVLRDGSNGLISDFMTNAGKSVPIWVLADGNGDVKGFWGPRPQPLSALVADFRRAEAPRLSKAEIAQEVQRWYILDKGVTFFEEAAELLKDIT